MYKKLKDYYLNIKQTILFSTLQVLLKRIKKSCFILIILADTMKL